MLTIKYGYLMLQPENFARRAGLQATEILLSGKSRVGPDGNLYGDVWGGWLNDFLINNYNRKNTASLGDYGWVRDESTGFIMQWGDTW
ncbi:Fels-2 prophage Pin [Salmonella enterica subsp. enterica]|uniref:Fels-2 prophage Pin n=1 Tax=Salmonella enterica I TaxID=59201 RepID=A0A447PAZ3_SALET|nr:Fels-2 prophage Pin [Salmonella enterica subsp. enterica]